MTALDHTGIAPERHRGPVIGALAVFGGQVERMVGLSLGWSLSLAPATVAFAASGLPAGVRLALAAATCLLVVPATGMLYALVSAALDGEELGLATAVEAMRGVWADAVRVLALPYLILVGLIMAAVLAAGTHPVVAVGAQLSLLVVSVCSIWWAPLLVRVPGATALGVLRGAALLVWRRPGLTVRGALASAVFLIIGVLTVAGAVLAVPAVLALIQVNLLDHAGEGDD
ncbi:hypothetical protein [Microlunatus sp. GCM10028923]|uniref:hypothetical protein n=1 Tax=Microlunatus sp. GCM10028923 TaxID=3273400 RepID=UPI0036124BFA